MGALRGVLAGAAIVALVLTAAPPAFAHQPTITFAPEPAAEWTTQPQVSGSASHDGGGGVDRVGLRWESMTNHASPHCTTQSEQTISGGGATTVTFTQDATFPCNGDYRLDVTAVSGSTLTHSQSSASVSRVVRLRMPPETTSGVTADNEGRTVAVSWQPNGEADLYGYLVDRRVGSGSYSELTFTTSTGVVDDEIGDAGGTYTYRVWAVRLGPSQDPDATDDLVIAERPSSSASATVAPRSTTTTGSGGGGGGDGGSGDGGDGGGTDGGDGSGGSDGDGGSTGGGEDGSGGSSGGSGGGFTIAPTPTAGPPPRPDLSGFARLKEQQERERRLRSTTTDPGFDEELPYDDQGRPLGSDGSLASGRDNRSTFEEVVDRKAALVPIAGGVLLFVGALQVRYLTRRARQDL